MATVTMPQLGESVTEGTILQWLKQPGDSVALDDSLCEIETEKVTAELPSPFAGTMGTHLVAEGETVGIGTPLCEVTEPGSTPDLQESRPSAAAGAPGGARPPTRRSLRQAQRRATTTTSASHRSPAAGPAGRWPFPPTNQPLLHARSLH